jgi:NAD(P)-dependent dehydrogenase (short-subunit alcohol dehydrogenase family)
MSAPFRPLAVVTGASTGIGLELARLCAANGFDLVIAADEMLIEDAAAELSGNDLQCVAVQCDLGTRDGVEELLGAIDSCGRPVDALLANAGRGLGRAFLEQDIDEALRVVRTNIDGTIYLIHRVGGQMRSRHEGRILLTGSIGGIAARDLSSGLQRHEGVPRLLLCRAQQRARRLRRHCDPPGARCRCNGILRACRHDGHQDRYAEESRRRGRRQGGF